jgi:hypothetical protein
MGTAMIHFRCSNCQRLCFRYATQYERMMRERGQAWCLVCTPGRYHAPIASRELCDVSQRLIAWSHLQMAGLRVGRTMETPPFKAGSTSSRA